MWLTLVGIFVSMIIIWKACNGFEIAANYLGRNLTEGVKGATINAIGSSMPELLATTIALLLYLDKDGFAFGIGTTAGSAIFNSAIIPAVVVISVVTFLGIKNIQVSRKVVLRDGISLLIAEVVLILILANSELHWYHGLFLMGIYAVYMAYTLLSMKANPEKKVPNLEEYAGVLIFSSERAWILLLISIAVIAGACHMLVESCYTIGEVLNVRIYFVSVLLAAAATSIPDTVLSIKDAMAGEYDDSVSNALGSNIFDICFCLGLPLFLFSLFTGQAISIGSDSAIMDLRIMLLVSTFLIFMIMLLGKKMGLMKSFALLGIYAVFVYRIINSAL